jgi:hypothetical protein
MLIAMIGYNESFYTNLIHKYERARNLADITSKTGTIAIVTKTKPYTGEPKLLSQEDIITAEQVASL